MKKISFFKIACIAVLLLIILTSFVKMGKKIHKGPLFFQKFLETPSLSHGLIASTHTLLNMIKSKPMIRVLKYSNLKEEPIQSLDKVFRDEEIYVFISDSLWQFRSSSVKAYGLQYPITKPMVLGFCYRDLSREKITVLKHPMGANGVDLGIYFNTNHFSTGVYSGLNFYQWMRWGDKLDPGVSLFYHRGPYAGVEMSFQF